MLVPEHVGRHVGEDDAPGSQLVPVRVEVCIAKVVGDVLVPVIGLGDQQVRVRGGLADRVVSVQAVSPV